VGQVAAELEVRGEDVALGGDEGGVHRGAEGDGGGAFLDDPWGSSLWGPKWLLARPARADWTPP